MKHFILNGILFISLVAAKGFAQPTYCHIQFDADTLHSPALFSIDTTTVVVTDRVITFSLYELELSYDTSAVQILDILPGGVMDSSSHGLTWFAWQYLPDPLVRSSHISVVQSILDPELCASGPGSLFHLVVRGTNCGVSPITLSSASRVLGCSRTDTTLSFGACREIVHVSDPAAVQHLTIASIGDSLRFRWSFLTETNEGCNVTVNQYVLEMNYDASNWEGMEIIAEVSAATNVVTILRDPSRTSRYYRIIARYQLN